MICLMNPFRILWRGIQCLNSWSASTRTQSHWNQKPQLGSKECTQCLTTYDPWRPKVVLECDIKFITSLELSVNVSSLTSKQTEVQWTTDRALRYKTLRCWLESEPTNHIQSNPAIRHLQIAGHRTYRQRLIRTRFPAMIMCPLSVRVIQPPPWHTQYECHTLPYKYSHYYRQTLTVNCFW